MDGVLLDRDDESRAFAHRFFQRLQKMPNMSQAGVYSSTSHYLQAVQAAGTTDTSAVMRKMRELPVEDFFSHGGHSREDGRIIHDMYIVKVKTPADSHSPWDLYNVVAKIPGDAAFQSLAQCTCKMVTH